MFVRRSTRRDLRLARLHSMHCGYTPSDRLTSLEKSESCLYLKQRLQRFSVAIVIVGVSALAVTHAAKISIRHRAINRLLTPCDRTRGYRLCHSRHSISDSPGYSRAARRGLTAWAAVIRSAHYLPMNRSTMIW